MGFDHHPSGSPADHWLNGFFSSRKYFTGKSGGDPEGLPDPPRFPTKGVSETLEKFHHQDDIVIIFSIGNSKRKKTFFFAASLHPG